MHEGGSLFAKLGTASSFLQMSDSGERPVAPPSSADWCRRRPMRAPARPAPDRGLIHRSWSFPGRQGDAEPGRRPPVTPATHNNGVGPPPAVDWSGGALEGCHFAGAELQTTEPPIGTRVVASRLGSGAGRMSSGCARQVRGGPLRRINFTRPRPRPGGHQSAELSVKAADLAVTRGRRRWQTCSLSQACLDRHSDCEMPSNGSCLWTVATDRPPGLPVVTSTAGSGAVISVGNQSPAGPVRPWLNGRTCRRASQPSCGS